ncbi:MAG: dihydroneopterin aldolase [Candidatus Neomarinimicrobiota bacterium]|nr:MAG: dihydroneopterin aldolase [Candidatus Neomarinimicrobiota bacterium]
MDVIRLKNMLFYGYHGVNESEKELGGKFEVDLELSTSLKKPGLSDDLHDTVDYEAVYKTVNNCVESKRYFLLEALAEDISRSVINKYDIDAVVIRIRKPNAPVSGVIDTVEVELKRKKSDYA